MNKSVAMNKKKNVVEPVYYRNLIFFKKPIDKFGNDGHQLYFHFKGKIKKGNKVIYAVQQTTKQEYEKIKVMSKCFAQ